MKHRKITIGYVLSRLLLVLLLVLSFIPMLTMINMSLKQTVMIRTDFWGLPRTIWWENYKNAWSFVIKPIVNSLYVGAVSIVFILLFSSLSGYAFGKMKFKGKNFLFGLLLVVLMLPGTLLIIPKYEIIGALGVLNTFWALIIPYVFGGSQITGVVLSQTFFQGLSNEIFDAARIDGATEFQTYTRIALPLSKPILITIGVTTFNSLYNDYIWPTLVLTTGDKVKTFCQIVFNNATGKGATDVGLIAAAFVIGTLPLLVVVSVCMKYYISGMMIGSVKG